MKNNYQENLQRFERFCPAAVLKELETLDCNQLQFCQTEVGELNLTNPTVTPPLYYHSQKGALAEAQNWVEETYPIGIRVICVYGIGLGYYYEALKEWLRSNSSRFLVFIEDDLCVIKRFLETEIASEMLKDTQVILQYFETPGEKGWGKFRRNFEWFFSGFGQSKTCYEALDLYKKTKEHMYHLVKQQMIINQVDCQCILEELFLYQELVSRNFYHNLPYLADSGIAKKLEGHFFDIPVLVCGAGPSLNKHFDLLKELRNKVIIFGSGTAMNILTKNGIMPHFGYCVDPYDIQESRSMTNLAYEVPFFYSNRFYYRALPLIHGPRLFTSMGQGYIEEWFKKEIGLPITTYKTGGISTTNLCCNLAVLLGCNPIVLTGLDMAYTDSTRYAEGVSSHPSDQRTEDKVPKKFMEALGVHGEKVKTRWDWLIEASLYTDLANAHPSLSLINSTEGGLGIMEVPNLPLEEVVKRRFVHSYDIQNWIHSEIQESYRDPINKESLVKAIEDWEKSLEKSIEYCDKIIEQLQELNTHVGKEDPIPKPETIESTSTLIQELKAEPVFEYLLGPNERYFIALAAIDINKLTLYPDQFTQEQKVHIHFEMEKGRYGFFRNIAEIHLSSIKEGLRTFRSRSLRKTPEPIEVKNKQDFSSGKYEFKEGWLEIEDPELNLSIKEEFHPTLVSEDKKQSEEHWGKGLLSNTPNKLEGQVLLLYPDGKIKGEFFYKEGQIHGPSTFYGSDGKLLAKSWFLNGQRIGRSLQYDFKGNLYSLQRYNKEGHLHGKQEFFYATGVLKTLMNYSNGLLDGELKLYYPSGQVKREQHLQQGKLHGKEFVWSEDGKINIESEFKRNLPTGKTITWYPNGQMAKEVVFYDDPLNFSLQVWDEEGKLIQKQTSLPENPFQDIIQKSSELQKSIDEMVGKLNDLKKQSDKEEETQQ